jgi:hypothetical protein
MSVPVTSTVMQRNFDSRDIAKGASEK